MSGKHTMVFLDLEAGVEDRAIRDIGALREEGRIYHGASLGELYAFLEGADTLCGHNIVHHDLPLLREATGREWNGRVIDTLYLSPLLFPRHPYHALLKDDKLQAEELNNPLNDCRKTETLYQDEVSAFLELPEEIREIYASLLLDIPEFRDFWEEMNTAGEAAGLENRIRREWHGLICDHAELGSMIRDLPVETAYALAVIGTRDEDSVTPAWVLRNYPRTAEVLRRLCAVPCREGCDYCKGRLDLKKGLRRYFGFREFRTYDGEPLQENAARAAMEGESLLAVFPTGGGKSVTFQLPALMQGEAMHGLTVVISPLQSLMKDQVDHLEHAGLVEGVTLNGMMSPIERSDTCRRVLDGSASLLFIAPEQLRSRTVERLLESRTVVRFVIDEAHCFSSWGQDFRVDYLYIGDFIRQLQEKRSDRRPIPVSCFTATAKQKVISDIRDYFSRKLNVELTLFASGAERENLHYRVLFQETDQEKYNTIRTLLEERNCPVIIYVSRTKRTRELAERLNSDGFSARPFNGKMTPAEKIENQEAFLKNQVRIMVATTAFGMGVDKKDVGMVIHYDISDSLENYVQEAGRAGRDPGMQAECYVLFNNSDLDKHFILLNQTKLSMGEIQQVWRAIKDMTRGRPDICCSPLEIARQAGWDVSGPEMETRVKTAVSALENAGYISRGQNMPHIYASSIQAAGMEEAGARVRKSSLFSEKQKQNAIRILQFLISRRSIARAGNDEAESRVDYISDLLGLEKKDVIETIHLLRQEGLLADAQDMSAYLLKTDSQNKSEILLSRFRKLEEFLLNRIAGRTAPIELKKLNEEAEKEGLDFSTVRHLRTVLYYWTVKDFVQKREDRERDTVRLEWNLEEPVLRMKFAKRMDLCSFALKELYRRAGDAEPDEREYIPVTFSLVELFRKYGEGQTRMQLDAKETNLNDLEDALLYLSRIGAVKLEGGFLVLYHGMKIHRIVRDNRIRYKQEDYRLLDDFYRHKIQQIHIVGEYANMMVKDYQAALTFVRDYFRMEYQKFIQKYFRGERAEEIRLNITPARHRQIFGDLSPMQEEIIRDAESECIVAAAGPGSGKTWVLVRKLASLLLMEDVKHDQMLMLTFTRAAATEFRKRLHELIGNAAFFVEIKTFHSYCFDLIGKTGSLEESENVVSAAVRKLENGEIEPGRIRKSVLVIDEAQDMDEEEYRLVRGIMDRNEALRVIAVGDDDQNIFAFRGSSSRYMKNLSEGCGARIYEMTENYRSLGSVVAMENAFAARLPGRMKTRPLRAVREGSGKVLVTRHAGKTFRSAVIRQIQRTWNAGSAAVLTSTNEEALQLFTMLKKAGLRARLIQGMDGFSLENVLEIRVFLSFLDDRLRGRPMISKELWDQAVAHTERICEGSEALKLCENLWRDFETTHRERYRSDLGNFIRESREEDFEEDDRQTIQVSTIHKAKGREFDQVYLVLHGTADGDGEEMRKVYVGLTRARDELYVHCPADGFRFALPPEIQQAEDAGEDPAPEEVMLQLGHRDVVLSYFRSRERLTGRLRTGQFLGMEGEYLTVEADGRTVRAAKMSKACEERISGLRAKGYEFTGGRIRHIVAWKGEEDPEECWIILPDLILRKNSR